MLQKGYYCWLPSFSKLFSLLDNTEGLVLLFYFGIVRLFHDIFFKWLKGPLFGYFDFLQPPTNGILRSPQCPLLRFSVLLDCIKILVFRLKLDFLNINPLIKFFNTNPALPCVSALSILLSGTFFEHERHPLSVSEHFCEVFM